jgi:large subunit ribosomal protein L18
MNIQTKQRLARLRRQRVRQKVVGTPERPRMSVKFTGQHIYVQFIDDNAGKTLAAASTRAKDLRAEGTFKANSDSARRLGTIAARLALDRGLSKVVFDRGSAKFHGKVKALADAAREAGLKF